MDAARAFRLSSERTRLHWIIPNEMEVFGTVVVVAGHPFNGPGWAIGSAWCYATINRLQIAGMISYGMGVAYTVFEADALHVIVSYGHETITEEVDRARAWWRATLQKYVQALSRNTAAPPTAFAPCSKVTKKCKGEEHTPACLPPDPRR
jgi:multidrug transporter EmrE-like cation transporter